VLERVLLRSALPVRLDILSPSPPELLDNVLLRSALLVRLDVLSPSQLFLTS